MYGTYVGNNRMLASVQWGSRLFCAADDLHVMPLLICHGVHEQGLTNYLIKTVKPGMRVVDVGANIGYYTVLLARLVKEKGYVAAFEPLEKHLNLLRMNLTTNYLTELQFYHIQVFPQAVGDVIGECTLQWSEGEEGGASIRGQFGTYPGEKHSVEVPCTTLDATLTGDFDLIKIDAEGNDCRVFLGAPKTLERTRQVVFEWNQDVLGTDVGLFVNVLNYLLSLGAKLYVLDEEGNRVSVDLQYLRDTRFNGAILLVLREGSF